MITRERARERGFTLVELMMSLVIFSIAVAGILSVAVSLTNGFREQRQAINAQDAVRNPLELVADALRQGSPGVSITANVHDTVTCSSGSITVTNNVTTAVYTNQVANTDMLDIVYANGGAVTSTVGTAAVTNATTSVNVVDGTAFQPGDLVLITDFATGHLVKLSNGTTGNTLGLTAGSCGSASQWTFSYTQPATIIRVRHARFYIAYDSDNLDELGASMPTLWMDPDANVATADSEPLADAIEDLQLSVGVDADGLGGVDDWFYTATSTGTPGNQIRAVRVTMIARTTQQQRGATATYNRPAAEDRTAGAMDRYRRRTMQTVVELRNISGSP